MNASLLPALASSSMPCLRLALDPAAPAVRHVRLMGSPSALPMASEVSFFE